MRVGGAAISLNGGLLHLAEFVRTLPPSWPGLTRPSSTPLNPDVGAVGFDATQLPLLARNVRLVRLGGRVKPGHDGGEVEVGADKAQDVEIVDYH
jgi:hypothetical protein